MLVEFYEIGTNTEVGRVSIQVSNKPLFMCHLSVTLVPYLGKTTRSPQSDLTPWILTLEVGLKITSDFSANCC